MKLSLTREETLTATRFTLEVDKDMFNMVCLLVGIFIVGSGVLKFFSMLI